MSDAAVAEPLRSCDDAEQLTPCLADNADAVCVGTTCQVVLCREGFVDCDGAGDNGCEATLDSVEHCGACGASCALSQVARYSCDEQDGQFGCSIDKSCPEGASSCRDNAPLAGCVPGFGDCDGVRENGCETRLNTLANCGNCGAACAVSGAQARCDSGQCEVVGCAPGSGDCDGDGCRLLVGDAGNCGACGNACPQAAPNCVGGRCTALQCEPGSADCDGDADNGCEAALATLGHCGGCDLACSALANAQVTCNQGSCGIGSCSEGFADCDGDASNGCETDLADPASCGACNNPCAALPNVSQARCEGGACAGLVCEPGFGDCDGDPANGCEQSLHTLAHCGACDSACDPPHATGECADGTCTIVACQQGMEECNGVVADGCEADLTSATSCGGCGNVCSEGARCLGGGCGCATDADCAQGLTCCDGSCIDTDSHCVWWPCIPGTSRDRNHCGGCSVPCLQLACCAN